MSKMQYQQLLIFCTCILLWCQVVYSKSKDYYDILGVPRDSSDRQIKKAFRKLAVKYHPDKNKDPDAEKKFVEIAKAYEVLSDPNKRRQYDQLGPSAFEDQANRGGAGGGGGFDFNFHDFFKNFDDSFNAFHGHDSGHRRKGGNTFGFNFGGSHFKFDQDFWGDDGDDDDFGFDMFGDFFGSHGGGGNGFHFNFGGPTVKQHHQNTHTQTHKTVHKQMNTHTSGGRTCRTVTQRVGNMVTTYTDCS
ncbi:dnaJ homolog subfamily B member 9-like [Ptychodera flava]|uniref:dnaJ homolog subfamily B member 9-like n=1 Tax=Ptychodera flava TaxID=63121 RepID=UPI00396A624B